MRKDCTRSFGLPPGVAKYLRNPDEIEPGDRVIDLSRPWRKQKRKEKCQTSRNDAQPGVSAANECPEPVYPLDENPSVPLTSSEASDSQPWYDMFSEMDTDCFSDDRLCDSWQTMVGSSET